MFRQLPDRRGKYPYRNWRDRTATRRLGQHLSRLVYAVTPDRRPANWAREAQFAVGIKKEHDVLPRQIPFARIPQSLPFPHLNQLSLTYAANGGFHAKRNACDRVRTASLRSQMLDLKDFARKDPTGTAHDLLNAGKLRRWFRGWLDCFRREQCGDEHQGDKEPVAHLKPRNRGQHSDGSKLILAAMGGQECDEYHIRAVISHNGFRFETFDYAEVLTLIDLPRCKCGAGGEPATTKLCKNPPAF